jgi:cysteine-rich repeat protein
MSHTHLSRLGTISASLLGLTVIALAGRSIILNADTVFTKPDMALQGVQVKANNITIVFCIDKDKVHPTFPLMDADLQQKALSLNFAITEYGNGAGQQGQSYTSHTTNNSLTAFARGGIYSITTDTDLYFRCNDGLSTHDFTQSTTTPSTTTDTQSTASQTCPTLQCAQVDAPLGCTLVQTTLSNGCPACQIVSCPSVGTTQTQGTGTQQTAEASPLTVDITRDASESLAPGSVTTMNAVVHNTGNETVQQVSFSLNMPTGYRLPPGATTGNCTGSDNHVTCQYYVMTANQTLTFSFPFVVTALAACDIENVQATVDATTDNQTTLPEVQSTPVSLPTCNTVAAPSSAEAVSSAPATVSSSAQVVSSTANTAASSSAAPVSIPITAIGQDDTLSVQLIGQSIVKAPGTLSLQLKISNKTNQAVNGIQYSFAVPFSGGAQMQAGTNCSIANSVVTCSNLSLQAGQSFTYNSTMQWSVTRDDCALPSSFGVNAQYNDSKGMSQAVGALLNWQWDCSIQTATNDWADVTAAVPAHVQVDTPFSWSVTVQNKLPSSTIAFWLDMVAPADATLNLLPGCGQGGQTMYCASDSVLAKAAQSTYTFGNLILGKNYCDQDVTIGQVRAANAFQNGIITVMGQTGPLTVHVDCGVVTTPPASSSTQSSSSSSAPTPALTATLSGPDGLQKNANATYTLVLRNTSTTTLNNVGFSFTFPTGITTNSISTLPTCAISTTSMSCSQFSIQPQLALTLTLPIHTLDTLPCSAIPLSVTATGNGQSFASNIIQVKGCTGATEDTYVTAISSITSPLGYLPKNTTQSMLVTTAALNTSFTNGQLHIELPQGFQAATPVNTLQVGTCTANGTSIDCTGIDRGLNQGAQYTLPFFISDSASCGAVSYGLTFSYLENGVQKQITKNQNVQLCTAATTTQAPLNQFSITTGAGVCTTSDCRTVSMPVTLHNMAFTTATNVMITANLDRTWSSGTLNGAPCQIIDTLTQRQLDCPGGPYLTIAPRTDTTYILSLTTDAKCPIASPRTAVLLQSAPASIYEQDYSDNSVYATIPAVACQTIASSSAGSSLSIGGVVTQASSSTQSISPINPAISSTAVSSSSLTGAGYALTLTSNPPVSGDPFKDYAPVHVKIGDSITITQHIMAAGSIENPFATYWDNSVINCTPTPAITSPNLQCVAMKAGYSTVYQKTYPVFGQDNQKEFTSNIITVYVDPPITAASSAASFAPSSSANLPIVCGNGVVQAFEICDDGNKIDTDACHNNCTINFNPQTCGNGKREGTEQCDDGNQDNTDTCSTKCTTIAPVVSICGDGKVTGTEECDDGNRVDTDSCSATCHVVSAQQNAKLTLNQLTLPAANAFSGQQDIPVMRFTAVADKNAVDLGGLGFSIPQSFAQPQITFTLWQDTNGDGVVDTKISDLATSGNNFATGPFTPNTGHIDTGKTVLFEVHANIDSSISPYGAYYNVLSNVAFVPYSVDATTGGTPLYGEVLNGLCGSYCGIAINASTTLSPVITVYRTGSLFVSRSYPYTSQVLQRGQLGPSALNLLFEAKREDVSVHRIQFSIPYTDALSVDHLDVFETGKTTPIGTATPRDCTPTATSSYGVFCLTLPEGSFVVPDGGSRSLEVHPFIMADPLANTATTHSFAISVQAALPSAYLTRVYTECGNSVCATGVTSNRSLAKSDGDKRDLGELIIGATANISPVIDRNVEGATQTINPN